MKTKALFLVWPLLLLLPGCGWQSRPQSTPSSTPVPASVLAAQIQAPDIRGEIVAVTIIEGHINAIHIEDDTFNTDNTWKNDTKYGKAVAGIHEQTRIYILTGDTYEISTTDQLRVGARVEVLFTGLVLEKYPVSAEAAEILIIP